MRNHRKLFALILLLYLAVASDVSRATVIMMVSKPDAVWIVADGLRSGSKNWRDVCKVHEAYGGVLFKFGHNDEGANSESTDADIERLLKSKRSFSEFKLAAAVVLRNSVASVLNHRPDLRSLEAEVTPQMPASKLFEADGVGLVFISVTDGRLSVTQLTVAPSVVAAPRSAATPYRLKVLTPKWIVLDQHPQFALYPPTIRLPSRLEDSLLQNPASMPIILRGMAQQTPCSVGPPYVFIKISAKTIDRKAKYSRVELNGLRSTAHIEWLDPGACPSWSAVEIQRPPACTPTEQYREQHQAAAAGSF